MPSVSGTLSSETHGKPESPLQSPTDYAPRGGIYSELGHVVSHDRSCGFTIHSPEIIRDDGCVDTIHLVIGHVCHVTLGMK
jgi:hypothetical protein